MRENRRRMTSRPPRKVIDGKVVSSIRTVYRISEDDIINVARERGVLLTEEQLDTVSRYVDEHFSPNGEWFDTIDTGLTSIGIAGQEDEEG